MSASLDFGGLLRRHRSAVGLSQEALAERARISVHGISALERGYRRLPRRETLMLLAGALALSEEQRRAFEAAAARPSGPRRRSETSVTVGPWTAAETASLPIALTRFVGREVELDEIAALLHDHRLVTLTGAGGVGKTQTALQAASSLMCDDAERVVSFVGLAAIADPLLVPMAIMAALGVQGVPDRPLLETLLAFLKNKTLLLVLDNCEHVIAEAAVVAAALLSGCPSVRILATSRQPLKAAGERRYRLPSLPAKDAVALFTDRAQAIDVHFTPTEETAPIVAQICARLDGIPLAIELAAARVSVLPPRQLLEQLDDRFRVLTGGERTAMARQRRMRATLDWSYELLSAPERQLFERLSVFAGGCTLAAAAAVCTDNEVSKDDVLELLSSLVDKSMVIVDVERSEPRYDLLKSFREYAREKLVVGGEDQTVRHRHALATLELAEEIDVAWEAMPAELWVELSRAEAENLLAASEWALVNRGDIVAGQRLVTLKHWQPFPLQTLRRWVGFARDLVHAGTPADILAALSFAECRIAAELNQHEAEVSCGSDALARYIALSDEPGVVLSEKCVANAYKDLGRLSNAKTAVLDAVARARRSGLQRSLGLALTVNAAVSARCGDFSAARRCIAEARAIYAAVGGLIGARTLMWTAMSCEFDAGNIGEAMRYGSEGLLDARSSGDIGGAARILNLMTHCLLSLRDYDQAKVYARETLSITSAHQLKVGFSSQIQHLVEIAVFRPRSDAPIRVELFSRCARLLGFVDACIFELGSPRFPHEIAQCDRIMCLLRDQVDAGLLARLMAEGATMTEDEAFEETSRL